MTLALWIGIGMFLAGAALRVWSYRPFVTAYAKRHSEAPPRSWLWTSSDDPVIERWRRWSVLGTTLLWAGAIVAILNPSM